MPLLPCPHCGLRDDAEFRWGGDADVVRPDAEADDAIWAAYLYIRRNPKGRNRERWLHWAGCGAWLVLTRDTLSHRIEGDDGPSPALSPG